MKYKIFETTAEIIGWILIATPTSIIGIATGMEIYNANSNLIGIILGIFLATAGLLFGIFWATKVWKKTGTVKFISRIYSTPELEEN